MRLLFALISSLIPISIYGGLHYWFWDNLVQESALATPWDSIAFVTLILLALSIPIAMIIQFRSPRKYKSLLWMAYIWLGMLPMLLVTLLSIEIIQFGTSIFFDFTPEQSLLLNRILAGSVAGIVLLLVLIGIYEAKKSTPIKHVQIQIPNLPDALKGFRIVQLTDIHVGPTVGAAFVEDLVTKTNGLEPDIVAITGDLVDGRVKDLGNDVSALSNLQARHGVYFVTGNHEYYSGVRQWMDFLPNLGIKILQNEHVTLAYQGREIDIAGIPDPTGNSMGNGHAPSLAMALQGRNPKNPLILLAHQPRIFSKAAEHGVSLQLSGHTHGGQFFPFMLAVKAVEPYVKGLYKQGNARLYVSPGNAYWGPPIRVGVERELTCIELV